MASNISHTIYEQIRSILPRNRRILSIQSHVTHGYAGNKCSVFPMQVNVFFNSPESVRIYVSEA